MIKIHKKDRYRKLRKVKFLRSIRGILAIFLILLCFTAYFNYNQFNNDQFNDHLNDLNIYKEPKVALNEPNARSLRISQHTTISNSFFPLSLPTNVYFTLVEGWTSEDITIYYEGVSQKKDWVLNGDFTSDSNDWNYYSNNNFLFSNLGWQSGGYLETQINAGSISENDCSYYKQNISISTVFTSNKLAVLSMDYYFESVIPAPPENLKAYMAVEIIGVEINKTIGLSDLVKNSWTTMSLAYDPSIYGQKLPENVTYKAGLYTKEDCSILGSQNFRIDNFKFQIWTKPNQSHIINSHDVEFNSNHSYYNTNYGKGYTFIDVERYYDETSDIIFTISKNITDIEDFEINNITITTNATKIFNSTINGGTGSIYTIDTSVNWQTEFSIFIPNTYLNNWAEIEKPNDWIITSILDGYSFEKIESCTGIGLGSEKIILPKEVLSSGLWTLEAISQNYINNGKIDVWNGTIYNEESNLTWDDIFQVNVTLNDTLVLTNTQI